MIKKPNELGKLSFAVQNYIGTRLTILRKSLHGVLFIDLAQ